jgi:hypothetical protein
MCLCGHIFGTEAPKPVKREPPVASNVPKEVRIYDEGGLGRKECPSCHKFVGVRVPQCACGHFFKKADKPAKPEPPKVVHVEPEETPQKVRRIGGMIIAVPAGECPIKLRGVDRESVETWADEVRNTFSERNEHLTVNGLCYYSRQFYEFHSAEYKTVKAELASIYPGEG